MKGMTSGGQLAETTRPKAEDPLCAERSSGASPVLAGRPFSENDPCMVVLFGFTEYMSHTHSQQNCPSAHSQEGFLKTLQPSAIIPLILEMSSKGNDRFEFQEATCSISAKKLRQQSKNTNGYYCSTARCKNTSWFSRHQDSNARLLKYLWVMLDMW